MAGCLGFTRAHADCPLLGGDDPPADALVAGEVEGVHDGGEAAAGDRAARAGEDLSARDFVCVFRLAGDGSREESLGKAAGKRQAKLFAPQIPLPKVQQPKLPSLAKPLLSMALPKVLV